MVLHNILGVGFLREKTQESAVLVGGPFKMGAQELVDSVHKFDFDFGRHEPFEPLLDDGGSR